jgi:hypothetical protein
VRSVESPVESSSLRGLIWRRLGCRRILERLVPDVPFYVVTFDTLYSGWGPAGDRDVFNVYPCETPEQAELVARTARDTLIAQTDAMILDTIPASAPGAAYGSSGRSNSRSVSPSGP